MNYFKRAFLFIAYPLNTIKKGLEINFQTFFIKEKYSVYE